MNYIKNILPSLLLLFTTFLSLTAQRVTDPTRLGNFYQVPNSDTKRLSAVQGLFNNEDIEYLYDDNNKIIRTNHYLTDDISGNRELDSYQLYLYNKQGQCWQIETYAYRKDNLNMVVSIRDVFEYNDKGQVTLYARWNNLNTLATDTTLVQDQKITIQYSESGLPNKAHICFLDPQDFEWYDAFDITLEYNERGQLYKRTALHPDGGRYEEEEITFDKDGRYMSVLTLKSENNEDAEWLFTPDDKGNLTSLGSKDFIFEFQFVTDQKAAETFYPEPSLPYLLLQGFRNYTLCNIPLLYNPSKEAVGKDLTNGGTFVYEENKPTYVEPIYTLAPCTITSDDHSWTIYGAETTVQLYTLAGECLQLVEPTESVAIIHMMTLPKGCYLIKVGRQTFKVSR